MSKTPPPRFRPYSEYEEYSPDAMLARAEDFRRDLARRRTVRHFAERPVPRALVARCLLAAGTAPSGANRQPWHFEVIEDPALKRRIREAAEAEERAFYAERAPKEWLEALAPLGTDAEKPFLERAPFLIAIFAKRWEPLPGGGRLHNYYVTESVGIATGLLIAALHRAGLATLTHTPSPMGFLREILGRPAHERPYLLLVLGYPAAGAQVPDIGRKGLGEIAGLDGGPFPSGDSEP
ncbi:MAG: nitroreductase family protein [Candidatus Krumholzibacteriia bacterium]|nr:nitroreductase family protein [Candidatus Latescibacterota bacterium]